MNIIKQLSYKPSKPVENYDQIKAEVETLKDFVITGKFEGLHQKAYCLHHAQVNPDSFNFFVVHPDYLLGNPAMFDDRVIINPEIVEYVKIKKPPLDKMEISKAEYDKLPESQSTVMLLEACMSFPYREPKRVERWVIIKVKYQNSKMQWQEETVTEIKAQIFQHEIGHAKGRNIYFEKQKI